MSGGAARWGMVVLRAGVSVALLVLIASNVDLDHAADLIMRISPWTYVAAVGLLVLANSASAVRWHVIARTLGPSPGPLTLLQVLGVGLFFNQVLPSAVGGDVIRVWRCHSMGLGLGAATKSVLLERATGFLAFVLVYGAGLGTLAGHIDDPTLWGVIVLVFMGAACGFALLLGLDRAPAGLRRHALVAKVVSISADARSLFKTPRHAVVVIGLSLVSFAFTVGAYHLFSRALGLPMDYVDWLVVVPPVGLISILPIFLAGWGIREGVTVAILGAYAVAPEAALAVSVLFGLALVGVGLPGSLIWLTDWDIKGASFAPPSEAGDAR